MEAPLRSLLPILGLLAVLAAAMVWVMVRFSAAMVGVRRGEDGAALEPERGLSARNLGIVYAILWVGIVAVLLRLMVLDGQPLDARNVGLLALVAGSWLAFNAGWIALTRALIRANLRDVEAALGEDPGVEAGEGEDPFGRLAAEQVATEIRRAVQPTEEEVLEAITGTAAAARPWWRRALTSLGLLAGAVMILAIGEAIPPLEALETLMAERQRELLVPVITLTVFGFALFMGGILALVLAQGQPMSQREIEEFAARGLLPAGPRVGGGGAYRQEGEAIGAEAGEQFTLGELKIAWRSRAWQFSRRWRRIFVITLGAALMSLGMLGLFLVLAPAGVKLLIALVALYAAAHFAIALVRA